MKKRQIWKATNELRYLTLIIPNDFGGGPCDKGLQQKWICEDGSEEWRGIPNVFDDTPYVAKWGQKPDLAMRFCNQMAIFR